VRGTVLVAGQSSRRVDAAGVLRALAELAAPYIPGHGGDARREIREREQLGSTAIGGGVAMPHCRCPETDRPLLLLARSAAGVPFGASDGAPIRLFVAVVTPAGSPAEHLRALAQLSRRLRDAERIARLLAAQDAEAMLAAWRREADEAA
jgi:nitrogen PTS system EIIA component